MLLNEERLTLRNLGAPNRKDRNYIQPRSRDAMHLGRYMYRTAHVRSCIPRARDFLILDMDCCWSMMGGCLS